MDVVGHGGGGGVEPLAFLGEKCWKISTFLETF